MAKKVLTQIKLQAVGGQASPAPPVGPALGQHGINIMEFCKAFNAQTQSDAGTVIPVVITVYEDRSFTFVTKTPPAAVLIKQAIGIVVPVSAWVCALNALQNSMMLMPCWPSAGPTGGAGLAWPPTACSLIWVRTFLAMYSLAARGA